MRNDNVLIAFANEKISDTVIKMLGYGNIKASFVCASGSDLKKQFPYFNGGIIICGYNLKDGSVIQLIDDIPDKFSIVLIGSRTQMELCTSGRVFKLAVPLHKEDLICSVSMLMNMEADERTVGVRLRSDEEKKVIQLAKECLIDKYGMSEEQAHRYMQKKSMDTGSKLADIAGIILDGF